MTQTLLITGASRGIGAAAAVLAAHQGWQVAVNYVSNAQAASDVIEKIRASGGKAIAVQGDMGIEADVLRVFATVDAQLGRIQGLVNNAGVVDRACRVDDMSLMRLERMWRTNISSVFLSSREAIRRMSTRHGGAGGSIVNLSSVAARLGGAGQYIDYAASKGAMDTFTLGLSKELATEGIRVNAVRPGIIETDIHASGGQPDRAQQLAPQIPMQRPGTSDEVAQAICWLLSEEASYTTGAILDEAGGR